MADNALQFDGVNERGGNNYTTSMSTLTLSCWIKTSGAGSGYRGIINKQGNWAVSLNNNILAAFDFTSSTGTAATTNIADGNWHHLVAILDDGVVNGSTLWVDNSSEVTFTYNFQVSTSNGLGLANAFDLSGFNTQNLNGTLDELVVWTRALTSGEVGDLYNSGSGLYVNTANNFASSGTPISTSLFGLWHFDDTPSTTTAADTSGNSRDWTLQNMELGDWVAGKVIQPVSVTAADSVGTHTLTTSGSSGAAGRVAGKVNNCYQFNGTDDYFTQSGSQTDFNVGRNLTTSFWVNLDANTSTDMSVVNTTKSGTSVNFHAYIKGTGAGAASKKVHFEFEDSGSTSTWRGNTDIDSGTWYYVLISHVNGAAPTIFVDNSADTVTAVSTAAGTTRPTANLGITVGAYNAGASGFLDGKIDVLAVYKRIMDSDDRTFLYNSGAGTESLAT